MDNAGAVTPTLYAAATTGCPQSTAPITATTLIHHLDVGKAASVKFRCEREVLADALATAGRAATSRTGTLPVLSGLRLEVDGRRAVASPAPISSCRSG